MAKRAKKQNVVDEISGVIDDVVEQAESALNRGWDMAFEVLPDRAEALVEDFRKQTVKFTKDLDKQTKKLTKDFDKQRKQAVKRVEKTISDLDKRRARVAQRAEKRVDDIVGTVERNVSTIVRPVAQRLDLASQSEVASLKRRLAQIEKKVGVKTTTRRTTRKTTRRAA